MKLNFIILLCLSILTLVSCTDNGNNSNSTTESKPTIEKHNVYWVSGKKVPCSVGAGKGMCLQVYQGEKLEEATWKSFYATIKGFEFEEGYYKKIEVKEEQLDSDRVPADASSIKYTLVKELDNRLDYKSFLQGEWTLIKMNSNPISKMMAVPILNIDVETMKIAGSDGCNNYSASINKLTANEIAISPIASTKKLCRNKNIGVEYTHALAEITSYSIGDNQQLTLSSEGNTISLTYLKND